ncbi:MAG: tetratricopeptide repeat protein [Cytophagales bacterium]|nr:tetratricopeptide repeat protein [Cytophagales bacterium]
MRSLTFLTLLFFGCYSWGQSSRYTELYEQAQEHSSKGNQQAALESINDAINLFPQANEAYFLRGNIFESVGDNVQALNDYSNAIRLNDSFKEAYFKRGELFYHLGVYDQAIKDFTYLIKHQGDDETQAVFFKVDPTGQEQVKVGTMVTMMSSVYSYRGLTFQEFGDYDEALDDLDEAMKLDSSAQNLVNRALLYEETGKTHQAIADLKLAVQLDPISEIAWFNLIVLDASVELPRNLLDQANFAPMLTYQGVEAYDAGRYGEADRLFGQAMRMNHRDPDLLLNVGRLRIKQERYPEARTHFNAVIQMEGSRMEAYYLMGNAFFREQKFDEAVAFYEQFLVRDRSKAHIWYNTAMAYFELNDREQGCDYLKQAVTRGMTEVSGQLARNCHQ